MNPFFYSLSCILAMSVSGAHPLAQRDMADLIICIQDEDNQ